MSLAGIWQASGDIKATLKALHWAKDPQGTSLHMPVDSLSCVLSQWSLAMPRKHSHRQAYAIHKQQAAAYRRQKLQSQIMLAAMERRVARLRERLDALHKLRLRSPSAESGAATTWPTQPEH
ncbi:hypothetical protein WJX81_005624 [Elliptochloris bilobata]|uniref:Uncharacterized protein n=1 Tax=Elliptochloris bilobata TaxID=381761 RepID=A0AAW1RTM6_9CHLO